MSHGELIGSQTGGESENLGTRLARLFRSPRSTGDPPAPPGGELQETVEFVPEGVEWTDDHKYWYRIGDLGNGVQQASAVKVMRMLIGVDDCASELRLVPRLPDGWSAIRARSLPALTGQGIVHLEMNFERRADGSSVTT